MPSRWYKTLDGLYANRGFASRWSIIQIAAFNIARRCTCYQRALAERINGILKTELLLINPENLEQARTTADEAVQIYNTERPHMALKSKNARCSASGVPRPIRIPQL